MPTYSTSGDGGPVQQFWETTTPFSHHHSLGHNDLKVVVVAPERAPARGAVLNEEMWECAQKTSRFNSTSNSFLIQYLPSLNYK